MDPISRFVDIEAAAGDDEDEDEDEEEEEEEEEEGNRDIDHGMSQCTRLNYKFELNGALDLVVYGEQGTAAVEQRVYDGFEEFINFFEARYIGNARATPPSPRPTSLNITAEGQIQAPLARPNPPCWLRLKKKITNFPAVKRYKSDLALAIRRTEAGYDILVVPRFKFKFEVGRKRPEARLFMSKFALVVGTKGKAPKATGTKNGFFFNGDEILEPFALKTGVPFEAFEAHASIKPLDIAVFHHGMADFWQYHPALSKPITTTFMSVSCHLYLRHPLQVGERVKAVSGYGLGCQGRIESSSEGSYTVAINNGEKTQEFDGKDLRRYFKDGDHVKVYRAKQVDWRGALGHVLTIKDDLVTVHADSINADVSRSHI